MTVSLQTHTPNVVINDLYVSVVKTIAPGYSSDLIIELKMLQTKANGTHDVTDLTEIIFRSYISAWQEEHGKIRLTQAS